jgi:uncharacterized protein YcnI
MNLRAVFPAAVAVLVLAPAAGAHVTLNPEEVPADSFARFDVRVPTERPDADTVTVTVQIPQGLEFVSFQPKPGWQRTVQMEELDQPVTNEEGETVTERIASVTWEGGRIGPGEFDEFELSARVPDEAGAQLVFPALQTYSSGEVVRWIGPADADEPAPRVTLQAAGEEVGAAQPTDQQGTSAAAETTATDDGGGGMETAALGFGIAGLVTGLVALGLVLTRRPRSA